MNIIKANGPATEKTPNIINPNDPVEWPEIEPAEPIIIKPTATPQPPPKPTAPTPIPESAIYIAGKDTKMDFLVRPTMEERLRLLHVKAEGKRWAAMQPRSIGKVFDPVEDEPWPYVVKLAPPAPRPNLKFNPETFTHISNHVKNTQPYNVVKEKPRIMTPLKTEDIRHIAIKPGNHPMASPINRTPTSHIIARPRITKPF